MKKLFFLLSLLISFQYCNSQITLEHSYNNLNTLWCYKIEGDGDKYIGTDYTNMKVILYNSNHTVYKSIQTNIPSGNGWFQAVYPSKYLYDSDNEVEVIISWSESVSGNTVYHTEIVNENGVVEMNFPNSFFTYVIRIDGLWKLILSNHQSATISYPEVYSLPGAWTGNTSILNPSGNGNTELSIFPNPVTQSATLNYSLTSGTTQGLIEIFDVNGSKIKEYEVTNQFNSIILNRNDIPAGMYFYSIKTANGSSESKKFIVQ